MQRESKNLLVGPVLGSTDLCVLTLKPMLIDLLGVMGEWLQVHICNVCFVLQSLKRNGKKKKDLALCHYQVTRKLKILTALLIRKEQGLTFAWNLKITPCTTFFKAIVTPASFTSVCFFSSGMHYSVPTKAKIGKDDNNKKSLSFTRDTFPPQGHPEVKVQAACQELKQLCRSSACSESLARFRQGEPDRWAGCFLSSWAPS